MAALADLAVVVVEVQARRAQVEFVGLVQIADTRGEDGVDAGRERRFVDRARLVEAEIAADGVEVEIVAEEIKPLQHVGLLDQARAQDAVPRPALVDGAIRRIEVFGQRLLLVQIAVLLEEDAQFAVLAEVHAVGDFEPPLRLGRLVETSLRADARVVRRPVFTHPRRRLGGIAHRPAGDVGGIPVVVDVVLVLVGTRDAQHDIFSPRPGPRDALRPEARHGQQHLQPAVGQIRRVAGIADVVENRVGDGAVAVDLLEGDLPLVVALLAVDGDHRVERRTVAEAQLRSVFDGLVELVVAVDEQFAGDGPPGGGQVERQAVGLGVPVGHAAVFLAREALRTDIQTGVHPGIGLQQHEDAEADALLRPGVAPDFDVAAVPAGGPGGRLLFEQGLEARLLSRSRDAARRGDKVRRSVVERRADARIFI